MTPQEFQKLVPGNEIAAWDFFAERFFVGIIIDVIRDGDETTAIFLNDRFQHRVTIENAHNVFLTTPMNKQEKEIQKFLKKTMRETVKESLKIFDQSLTPYLIRMFKQNMNDWENLAEIKLRKRKK